MEEKEERERERERERDAAAILVQRLVGFGLAPLVKWNHAPAVATTTAAAATRGVWKAARVSTSQHALERYGGIYQRRRGEGSRASRKYTIRRLALSYVNYGGEENKNKSCGMYVD